MNVGELIRSANRLKRQGKLEQVISEYSQIIKSNPQFYNAYYELGVALAKKGNLKDGINQLKLALEINPNSALCYYTLGEFLCQQGKLTQAIKYYRQALEINPNFYKFYYSLGNALAKVGDEQAANDAYKQAVRLNSDLESINRVKNRVIEAVKTSPEFQYLQLIFGDIATAKTELGIEQANSWVELYTQVKKLRIIKYISPTTQERKIPRGDSLVAHYCSDGEKIVVSNGKETRVCFIQDESGNENHLTQANVLKMPLLKENSLRDSMSLCFPNKKETILKSVKKIKLDKPIVTWTIVFSLSIEYTKILKNLSNKSSAVLFRSQVNGNPSFYGTFVELEDNSCTLKSNCRIGSQRYKGLNNYNITPGKLYVLTNIWDGQSGIFTSVLNGKFQSVSLDAIYQEEFNQEIIAIGGNPDNVCFFSGNFFELMIHNKALNINDAKLLQLHLLEKWHFEKITTRPSSCLTNEEIENIINDDSHKYGNFPNSFLVSNLISSVDTNFYTTNQTKTNHIKVFFVNDTRTQCNIGCRVTSEEMLSLITSAQARVFYTLSLQEVSYLYYILCAKLNKKYLQFQDFDNAFSLMQKEDILGDIYFKKIILNLQICDVVILNGEGGIYDLQPKGVMTLFIAYIAKVKFNKIVALVNHTTDISHPIMKEIVANVYPILDNIVYRENISFSIVSKEIPLKNSYVGADAAFNVINSKSFSQIKDYNPEIYRGIYPEEGFSMPFKKPIVCISGSSILFRKDRPQPQYPVISGISELVSLLRGKKMEVIFLAADANDYKLLKPVSVYLKVPIISASTPTYDNLGLLSNVDCVISGRWHLSILSCCVGTPIILGDANTFKTKALHEIFCFNVPMFSYLNLKSYLKTMSDSVEKVIEEAGIIRPKIESLAWEQAKKALLNVKILEL